MPTPRRLYKCTDRWALAGRSAEIEGRHVVETAERRLVAFGGGDMENICKTFSPRCLSPRGVEHGEEEEVSRGHERSMSLALSCDCKKRRGHPEGRSARFWHFAPEVTRDSPNVTCQSLCSPALNRPLLYGLFHSKWAIIY